MLTMKLTTVMNQVTSDQDHKQDLHNQVDQFVQMIRLEKKSINHVPDKLLRSPFISENALNSTVMLKTTQ